MKENLILLTGSSGFLGRTILEHLHLHNCEVLTVGRQVNSNVVCDLSKEIPLFEKNKKIDLVIHSAGKAHIIPKTEAEKQSFFDVNVTGVKNLLKGLERFEVLPKSFVLISSVSVYGLNSGQNISESAPLISKDPYGLSKIEAESVVLNWCNLNGVICSVLRLPLLVGSDPPGNLGAMIKGLEKGYYFNISGGKAKKSMVLANDVAKVLLKVSSIGGIYNLTDGYHPSFFELSNKISLELHKSKPRNMPFWLAKLFARIGDFLGEKAPLNSNKLSKITSDLTFDDNKAKKSFGWSATPVLDELIIVKKS